MSEMTLVEAMHRINSFLDKTDDELLEAAREADLADDEQQLAIIETIASGRFGGVFRLKYAARFPEQTRFEVLKRA